MRLAAVAAVLLVAAAAAEEVIPAVLQPNTTVSADGAADLCIYRSRHTAVAYGCSMRP